MSMDERRYSEDEVAEILQNAVEGDAASALAHSDGMSLGELKTIGAEVGIDPARIESAARALVRAPEARKHPLVGAPTSLDYEARVPGEIPPDGAPEVIATIRRIMGTPGKISELHGTLEWRTAGDMGAKWVTVSPREGHTTIRSSAQFGQGALISLIPTALATFLSAVPVLNAPSADGNMMALILIPLVAALYLMTRGIWSWYSAKEAARMQQVVEELSVLAGTLGETPPSPESESE